MQIGAQIWLNADDTYAQVDKQFAQLESLHMPLTRIFVMWNYIEQTDGSCNYKVYDYAFKAARVHKVKVVATLMPNFGPPHRGYLYKSQDGAIPRDTQALLNGMDFARRTVSRYRDSTALDSWMMMNEPGQMPSDDAWAMERFRS